MISYIVNQAVARPLEFQTIGGIQDEPLPSINELTRANDVSKGLTKIAKK